MSYGNEKLLEEISSYFQINDDDELTLNSLTINDDNEQDIPSLDILSQKFTAYQTQLRSTIPVDKLLEVYESANQFLKEWEWMDTELDQKVTQNVFFSGIVILEIYYRVCLMKQLIPWQFYVHLLLNIIIKQLNYF
jgi:hypothetical protein